MSRTATSQSKHDVRVRSEANDYKQRGYEVWADILGWSQPETFGGFRPDVIAKSNGHTTVVEVETPDSVNSKRDLEQQRAFKQWASRNEYRHYRRVVTS